MKITMYELLGMIKDGKAPKKIRYRYSYLYKDFKFDGETLNYISDKDFLFGEDITAMLNDEIEILEEKKIPEKLPTWFSLGMSHNKKDNIEYANYNFENMYEKINEIIGCLDHLKSKGE